MITRLEFETAKRNFDKRQKQYAELERQYQEYQKRFAFMKTMAESRVKLANDLTDIVTELIQPGSIKAPKRIPTTFSEIKDDEREQKIYNISRILSEHKQAKDNLRDN